jgi:hypothetical protein
MSCLIKFYGRSLRSPHGIIRQRIARHFVDLAEQKMSYAVQLLRVAVSFLQRSYHPLQQKRITELLGDDRLASLEF